MKETLASLICVCLAGTLTAGAPVSEMSSTATGLTNLRGVKWTCLVRDNNTPAIQEMRLEVSEYGDVTQSVKLSSFRKGQLDRSSFLSVYDGKNHYYNSLTDEPEVLKISSVKPNHPRSLTNLYGPFSNFAWLNAATKQKDIQKLLFWAELSRPASLKAVQTLSPAESSVQWRGHECQTYKLRDCPSTEFDSDVDYVVYFSEKLRAPIGWEEYNAKGSLLVRYQVTETASIKIGKTDSKPAELLFYPAKAFVSYFAWNPDYPQKEPINSGYTISVDSLVALQSAEEIEIPDPALYRIIHDVDRGTFVSVPN